MKKALFACVMLALVPYVSLAETQEKQAVHIEHPWGRPTMGEMRTTALYMTIKNDTDISDVLLGVSTPIAEQAALHSTVLQEGIARMLPLDRLSIPAHAEVAFTPGKLHIMLMGIKKPLAKGDSIPLTLSFEKAGEKTIEVMIE